MAVAGLAAGSIAGLVAVTDLRGERPVTPAADTSTMPSYDPSVFPGSQACLNGMEQYRADIPPEMRAGAVLPDPEHASFVGFPEHGSDVQVRLLIFDGNAVVTCIVDRAASSDDVVQPDSVGRPGLQPVTPAREQVILVEAGGSSETLGVGPGNTLYIGRVGEDVASVQADLPDGTTVTGVLSDGWFMIDAPVADGVELHDSDLITWTLNDGETRSAPATDLLQR
ncbi:MAG: hypothetical protein QM733_06865 [Ilumatobacteraceae bacterium]